MQCAVVLRNCGTTHRLHAKKFPLCTHLTHIMHVSMFRRRGRYGYRWIGGTQHFLCSLSGDFYPKFCPKLQFC